MIHTDKNFPDSLPCPLREDYTIEHVSPFIRTRMETGRARQRRRFTSVPSLVTVSWIFSAIQAQAFEVWFQSGINDGVDWFNCTIKTPMGLKPYVCRFAEMYDGPNLIGISSWRISARLEIWERPLLPPAWGLVPDMYVGMDIFDKAMNREWPE